MTFGFLLKVYHLCLLFVCFLLVQTYFIPQLFFTNMHKHLQINTITNKQRVEPQVLKLIYGSRPEVIRLRTMLLLDGFNVLACYN